MEAENDSSVIVYGNSSSGKTISTALAVDQMVNTGHTSYTWIDLSDVNVEVEHLFYTLASKKKLANHVVIIDNVQSHPSKIVWILKVIRFVSLCNPAVRFKIVNICWRSARKTVLNYYLPQQVAQIECSGDDTIVELIRYYSLEKYEKEILANSSGDVLIAKSTIEFILSNAAFPSEKQLAHDLFKKATHYVDISEEALLVLFVIASLGEFEIHVSVEYLDSISKEGVNELLQNKVLRTYKTEDEDIYVAIGHRSLAHKLLSYLKTVVANYRNPIELAIEYLTINGDRQILSTLERLDLELETNDSVLAKLWLAFCNMRDSVFKQIAVDPTWGNNMASMIFATEALNNMMAGMDVHDSLSITYDEIRKRWRPSLDRQNIEFVGANANIDVTTEIVDFVDNIKRTMSVDELTNVYDQKMLSSNIDYQKFHDNWLLGLLLGFEGSVKTNSYKEAYIECAANMQLADGAFYPERVCWVTARVIMGLCQCGLNYSNSVVRKACNWLVDQLLRPDEMKWAVSDLKCFGWRSGTGTWNSDEQITLMCVCALFEAQYPIRKNEKVASIVYDFWRCRKQLEELFIRKGTVLDIVVLEYK